jgi:hypothetical protein
MEAITLKKTARIGISIITTLAISAISVISLNVPASATFTRFIRVIRVFGCNATMTESSYSISVINTDLCAQVQVAARCYISGVYFWSYGSAGKSSSAGCPSSVRGFAVRGKLDPTASWGPWNYF